MSKGRKNGGDESGGLQDAADGGMLGRRKPATINGYKLTAGELRARFVSALVDNGIDPIQGMRDLLDDADTPPDVKARLYIEITKLLIPAAPKMEDGEKTRDVQVIVTSFKSLAENAGDGAKRVVEVPALQEGSGNG